MDIDFLFVNDNSTDRVEIIHEFFKDFDNCSFMNLTKNVGKANAIRLGIKKTLEYGVSEIKKIGYLDFDAAIAPGEIKRLNEIFERFLSEGKKVDSIWASRVNLKGRYVKRTFTRHIYSRIVTTILGLSYPDLPYDSQCGFKIFLNTSEFSKVFDSAFKTRWFVDLEILERFNQLMNKPLIIWEEPLLKWNDIKSQNFKLINLFNLIYELFYISIKLRGIRN